MGAREFRHAMSPNSCLADYLETLIGKLQQGRRLVLENESAIGTATLQTAMYEASQIHYHMHALELGVFRGLP